MSIPTTFVPNSDPFRGGSFTPAGSAGGVNGAIGGASTGSSLIGGVTGGTPMLARNTRGSNITVPYARVVFHPPGNTALTPVSQNASDNKGKDLHQRLMKSNPENAIMTETEHLFFGRLAFVLGRRGKSYVSTVESAMGLDMINIVGGSSISGAHARTTQLALAPGTGGTATAQRLCSFEYLQRYFHHVLANKSIPLADVETQPTKYNKKLEKAYRGETPPTLNDLTNVEAGELVTKMDQESDVLDFREGVDVGEKWSKQGANVEAVGIFLHGMVASRRLSGKSSAAGIGDEIFDKYLQEQMIANGLLDWMPDGVVMSKLSQGDRILDDELDSRDGMLFNVAIAGPAISTLWSQDRELDVMPLDKVFILYVAKVEANVLSKFRVMLATSAQLVAAAAAGTRMNLESTERIVGGWSIGTVIDSAASRATEHGAALMGAVKRARINSAHNVVVDVKWWSGDLLFRNYGDLKRRTRYDPPKPRVVVAPRPKPAAPAPATASAPATAP